MKSKHSELMKDICCSKYDFDYIATKHNMSKEKIVDSVNRYVSKCDPELAKKLRRNINVRILKEFVSYNKSPEEFAKQYRISFPRFIRIVSETIQNPDIVPSDAVADSVFRKAIQGFKMTSTAFPERIVIVVCKRYARNPYMSQRELAQPYDLEHRAIANVLRRGIAENLVSDEVAECIYQNVMHSHFSHSERILVSYERAFEQRRLTKLKQKLAQMEAMFESDEPINYDTLSQAIVKLKLQIADLEQHLAT